MAVVLTYCRRSQHDRYFFDDPLRLLGGAIEAPTFNLRNPLMVAKHLRSAILSELLLRSSDGGGQAVRIRETLKQLFPIFCSYNINSRYRRFGNDFQITDFNYILFSYLRIPGMWCRENIVKTSYERDLTVINYMIKHPEHLFGEWILGDVVKMI